MGKKTAKKARFDYCAVKLEPWVLFFSEVILFV